MTAKDAASTAAGSARVPETQGQPSPLVSRQRATVQRQIEAIGREIERTDMKIAKYVASNEPAEVTANEVARHKLEKRLLELQRVLPEW